MLKHRTGSGMGLALAWAISLVLLSVLAGCSCNDAGGEQGRQIGEKMGQMSDEGRAPTNYKYVANMGTQLYWPNLVKYEDAIPSDKRVYIKDAEALEQFKGWKPGPL